jgi:hypothetical protein
MNMITYVCLNLLLEIQRQNLRNNNKRTVGWVATECGGVVNYLRGSAFSRLVSSHHIHACVIANAPEQCELMFRREETTAAAAAAAAAAATTTTTTTTTTDGAHG